jgi:hypothetical protein
MDPEIYAFLERCAPWLTAWVALFSLINVVRITAHLRRGDDAAPHSSVFAELPGLPLTLLHSALFFWGAARGDWVTMLLFAWWGPGFLAVVVWLISLKARGKTLSWTPMETFISWACKLNYLALLIAFIAHHLPMTVFLFSAWIINDQIGMAFLSLDADRLRRTLHDKWIVRLAYPLGLLTPLIAPSASWPGPLRWLCLAYGVALLFGWLAGIVRVWRRGLLTRVPDDPTLFRNMVYHQPGTAIDDITAGYALSRRA